MVKCGTKKSISILGKRLGGTKVTARFLITTSLRHGRRIFWKKQKNGGFGKNRLALASMFAAVACIIKLHGQVFIGGVFELSCKLTSAQHSRETCF